MAVAIANIFNVFATPTEVFQDVREKPTWLIPFLFIAVVALGVAFFTVPIIKRVTYLTLSSTMQQQQLQQALAISERAAYFGIVLAPLLLLFRWLFLATVLYFVSILLGAEQTKFKVFYAVPVYSELILALMEVVNILLLYIKGVENLQHSTDLQAIVGLDYFLPDKVSNLPLFTFLNSVNVFSIWYVATLAVGVSVITNFTKLKSAVIVTTVWLFGVAFQVVLAMISSQVSAGLR